MIEVAAFTGAVDVAGAMKVSTKKLKTDDGVDDHDEQNEQGDVQQWNHSFKNGIQHHLETWHKQASNA